MKPATRFLTVALTIVLELVVLAVVGVVWQTHSAASESSLKRLQVSSEVEHELQANRLQELQLRAELLAQDPSFVDYVAQSLIPNPQLGGAVDSASISDLLKDRRKGYDVAMVLDPQGKLVATSGVLLKAPSSVQHDPLVQQAIGTLQPVQGAWVDHGQLLWVSINPLLRGGTLQGLLIAASNMDNSFTIAVNRISRSGIAFVMPPDPGAAPAPASGVNGWVAQALRQQEPELLALKQAQAFTLSDGTHDVTVWVTPLTSLGGSAVMVAVDPAAASTGWLAPAATPLLLGVLAFGAIGVLLALLLWRHTWLPLQRMLEVIERATHTGDPNLTARVEGSHIVRRLRDVVNPLLQRIARREGDRQRRRDVRTNAEFSRAGDQPPPA